MFLAGIISLERISVMITITGGLINTREGDSLMNRPGDEDRRDANEMHSNHDGSRLQQRVSSNYIVITFHATTIDLWRCCNIYIYWYIPSSAESKVILIHVFDRRDPRRSKIFFFFLWDRSDDPRSDPSEVNTVELHRCFFLHLFFVKTDFKRDPSV